MITTVFTVDLNKKGPFKDSLSWSFKCNILITLVVGIKSEVNPQFTSFYANCKRRRTWFSYLQVMPGQGRGNSTGSTGQRHVFDAPLIGLQLQVSFINSK